MLKQSARVALLLALAALAPAFAVAYQESPADATAKYRQTIESMKRIVAAIGNYAIDFGYAPKVGTAAEFKKALEPYSASLPRDAWGNDLYYECDKVRPECYRLASAGSDGVFKGFDQGGRWSEYRGEDIVLTNTAPYWLYTPEIAGLPLPDLDPDKVREESYETHLNPGTSLGIVRRPGPADYGKGKLASFPAYDPNSDKGWQIDVRSADVSGLDLRDRTADLLNADFDSKTKWPGALPAAFDPARTMELGKDPGLGLRRVHEMGITGQGVGIAIIDQPLLVDHAEYKNRLKFYEEIHQQPEQAAMHGPAVASIAVGKTVGVAPGADLYYIAETHGTYRQDGFDWDFGPVAKSIDRILEINRTLPPANKIRVISISVGWSPKAKGYAEVTAAVERAKKDGVFVVSSSLFETSGKLMFFHGLGRDPKADPGKAASFGPGAWWSRRVADYLSGKAKLPSGGVEMLLIPMDSRCTASPTGVEDYAFYRQGGWSWVIPYVAGLYALACQVDPAVTPESFWSRALETGTPFKIEGNETSLTIGKIVDPEKLLIRKEAGVGSDPHR